MLEVWKAMSIMIDYFASTLPAPIIPYIVTLKSTSIRLYMILTILSVYITNLQNFKYAC